VGSRQERGTWGEGGDAGNDRGKKKPLKINPVLHRKV